MKLKDFLLSELEEPFPKTHDGKLLVGEVELLRLVAERECAPNVTTPGAGQSLAADAPKEPPEGAER